MVSLTQKYSTIIVKITAFFRLVNSFVGTKKQKNSIHETTPIIFIYDVADRFC